jgi:alkylation response protein AidB-like acyl-CoA dehydrogenase
MRSDISGFIQSDKTASEFVELVNSGELDLPLPGSGRTQDRWFAFEALGGRDLSLARLSEGHADAVAILAELGGPEPGEGSRWGVWAARPPGPGLVARQVDGCWRVSGVKQYCSGARSCTDALVTATAPDGERLFAVSTRSVEPLPGTWPATGMAGSDTLNLRFRSVQVQAVGQAGSYVTRPGFAHGGVGVAACWYGGARAVGYTLASAAANRDIGPHALAHLGAVDIALRSAKTALDDSAAEIDADPLDHKSGGRALALRVRALVEATATEVMHRVGRSLGAGPLSHDEAHGRRVADLTVYLRQHHAERNLAELGAVVAESGASW